MLQGVHVEEEAAPTMLLYVPAGHSVGLIELWGQKEPAGHGVGLKEVRGQKEPAGQGVQVVLKNAPGVVL